MKRLRVAMLGALLCSATSAIADPPWYRDPGIPMTLHSGGFLLHARLPRGWTVSDDAILAPPALGAGCQVEVRFHEDRAWNDFLVAVLDFDEPRSRTRREVLRLGGHPAVSDHYVSGDHEVMNFYVDLSSLEAGSGVALTLRKRLPLDGGDCELQFLALVHSVTIDRDAQE